MSEVNNPRFLFWTIVSLIGAGWGAVKKTRRGFKNSDDDLVGQVSLTGASPSSDSCYVFLLAYDFIVVATFAQVLLWTVVLYFHEILHVFVILYLSLYHIYLSVHSIFVRALDWNVSKPAALTWQFKYIALWTTTKHVLLINQHEHTHIHTDTRALSKVPVKTGPNRGHAHMP